ncbi:uncharacterized protein PHALS_13514 [Plasmopara halstedii]|uniref:Uncharacterized protein n=1 Tax=Plasmopara halstedii TaxID=4781 RepID=A0A0P1AQX8_PLAHL|nr:uncharacterized protein PHALS_13514 [Plasmopara halstedii]CEG43311.1 hypothetical protein PHALS_13514 [Plasmopara halstedii]|eukprot:XP_024579680.1 hypothetical protein PHALS_13514 [Plasmopara halstedii]
MQRLSPASWFLRRNKALVYLCSRAYCLNRELPPHALEAALTMKAVTILVQVSHPIFAMVKEARRLTHILTKLFQRIL